jgi:FKBP-type peptidyl-prolyl cis-trans isomerase FklB
MFKKITFLLVLAAVVLTFTACSSAGGSVAADDLKTETDSTSYALGVNIGTSLRSQSIEINPEMLLSGLNAGVDSTSFLDAGQVREILMILNERMNQREMSKQKDQDKVKSEQNKIMGDQFRNDYKNQQGVKELSGGILYKVLKAGSGKTPTATDVVSVHYAGRLVDGQEFDSSLKSGQPAQFPVNGVIQGWQVALQSMKVGDKWEVVIPPDLAYGDRGAGEKIGPDATLVFEVELLSVETPK